MSVQPGLQAAYFGFQFGPDSGNLGLDFRNVGFGSNVTGDCIADGRYDGFGQWFRGTSFAERLYGLVSIEGERGHVRHCTATCLGSSTGGAASVPRFSQTAARLDTGRPGR